ncbi:MAG: 3-deoxy-7-phosphoheptulonate synthase [Bacteroidia bacterium]
MLLLLRPETPPSAVEEILLAVQKRYDYPAEVITLGERKGLYLPENDPDTHMWERNPWVEKIYAWEKPYPKVRNWQGEIQIGKWTFSKREPLWIAGPCSVEEKKSLLSLAQTLAQAGVQVLRGGIFKGRTSPYTFRGKGWEALEYLLEAKALTGLPLCVELLSEKHAEKYAETVDVIQIGARSMQAFGLLQAAAQTQKPILLKRAPCSKIDEFLLAAEYLLYHGAPSVLLMERGIRTFDNTLRYTLDVGAIAYLRENVPLPILADPSHAAGDHRYVLPLAAAALAAGAHGLMVEVHPQPARALSDAKQQLEIKEFLRLMEYFQMPSFAQG